MFFERIFNNMRYYSTKAAILCSVLFLIILCFICVFFSSPQVEDSLSKEYLYAFTLASEDDYVNEKEYKENEKKYKINEKINEVRIQDLSISVIKLGISRAHKILPPAPFVYQFYVFQSCPYFCSLTQ